MAIGFESFTPVIRRATRHLGARASHPRCAFVQPADVLPLSFEFQDLAFHTARPACPTTQQRRSSLLKQPCTFSSRYWSNTAATACALVILLLWLLWTLLYVIQWCHSSTPSVDEFLKIWMTSRQMIWICTLCRIFILKDMLLNFSHIAGPMSAWENLVTHNISRC